MQDTFLNRVKTGLDVLVADGFAGLSNKRVAILANQASVDAGIEPIHSLAAAHGVNVVKLFAPEHGFSGTLQDMEQVADGFDPLLEVPIISLYGDHKESLAMHKKHLDDVDVLLCDLQDVGARYYTFHCTIAWALAACAETGTKLIVLDRPNPINSNSFEGNLIQSPHFSFVGAYPLPNRHGFTMGELVSYVVFEMKIKLDFEIVWMDNYNRAAYFDELGLPFISPSPNMPSVQTAVVYPGMCLIEGTNLSEGRGTCTPFELVGAPYITDSYRFKKMIDDMNFAGVKVRACSFRPKFQKHADKNCNGIFIHVTDRNLFSPVRFAIGVIRAAMEFEGFSWRREPYEYETDRLAIDLLLGDASLRRMLEEHEPIDHLFARYQEAEKAFAVTRKPFLHYVG